MFMATTTVNKTNLKKALSNATASAKMEGFSVPDNHVKYAEAIVLGTMTKEDVLKLILAERK